MLFRMLDGSVPRNSSLGLGATTLGAVQTHKLGIGRTERVFTFQRVHVHVWPRTATRPSRARIKAGVPRRLRGNAPQVRTESAARGLALAELSATSKRTPDGVNCRAAASAGASCWQTEHHDPQKFSTITCPRSAAR